MRASPSTWLIRAVLFIVALAGPLAAYWLVLAATNDGRIAVGSLGWGFLASFAAVVAFGFTVAGRWPARLAWSFVFLTAAAAFWAAVLAFG